MQIVKNRIFMETEYPGAIKLSDEVSIKSILELSKLLIRIGLSS